MLRPLRISCGDDDNGLAGNGYESIERISGAEEVFGRKRDIYLVTTSVKLSP